MNKNLVELVFILDASGSMQPLTTDTVGGVNGILAEQRSEGREVLVSTVLFNTRRTVLHDRLPIAEVAPITEREYRAQGGTALLDAVGETLADITRIQHHIRPEDRPARTLVVIMTDGQENASRLYEYNGIKAMIGERERAGWEFMFLGANIDAAEAAASIGIARRRAAQWQASPEGVVYACRIIDRAARSESREALDAMLEDLQREGERHEK